MGERAKVILNEYSARDLLKKDTLNLDKFYTADLKLFVEVARKEIERLKKREQECIDHYLVQCKYASEMESKYITANNIIKEIEKTLEDNYGGLSISDYERLIDLCKRSDKE